MEKKLYDYRCANTGVHTFATGRAKRIVVIGENGKELKRGFVPLAVMIESPQTVTVCEVKD